jgi:NAD-dependent dihydropyrimidine dehydrogenase PreA subunit
MPGLFIDVKVSEAAAADTALAKKLTEVCPVNIYKVDGAGRCAIVEENLDECTLCELCLQAAPKGAVQVIKLYER